MGLVKTRRLAYPPLAGADDPWGSRQAERCECRAMQKQQRAKARMIGTANYRTELCQTAERDCAKLPNGFTPNYRMAIARC